MWTIFGFDFLFLAILNTIFGSEISRNHNFQSYRHLSGWFSKQLVPELNTISLETNYNDFWIYLWICIIKNNVFGSQIFSFGSPSIITQDEITTRYCLQMWCNIYISCDYWCNTIIYSLLVIWHTFIGSQILCFWNKSANNLCKESTSGKWLWIRCNTYISSISPYWLQVSIFPLHLDNTRPFLVRKNAVFYQIPNDWFREISEPEIGFRKSTGSK